MFTVATTRLTVASIRFTLPLIVPDEGYFRNAAIVHSKSEIYVFNNNANHYTTDEPTIYHTRGEQATHYAIDSILFSGVFFLNL
jgi:hypothetical protein